MADIETIRLVPPRRGETVTDSGIPTLRFASYLEDITQSVTDLNNDIINLAGTTQVVITGTYQSTGNQVIICNGVSTVTLDPSATDGTSLTIKRLNGQVTITAIAGIDGSSEDVILTRDNTSLDLVFVSEAGSWYIR